MRTIDADYLKNVLNGWQQQFDKNSVEYKMISQFINCVNAQNTVIDIQETINDIQDEKLPYLGDDTTFYNDGLEYAILMIKNNINPLLRNDFFDKEKDNEKENLNNNEEVDFDER